MTDKQIDEAVKALDDLDCWLAYIVPEYGDIAIQFKQDKISVVRQALERQQEEIDALSRLNRALDEQLAALEKV